MVTVLWYTGNTVLERAIKAFTRSTYTHTAILVDGVLYEALGNGVNRRTGTDATNRAQGAVAYQTVDVDKTPRSMVVETSLVDTPSPAVANIPVDAGGRVATTSDYVAMVRFLEQETHDRYSITQLITDGIAILTGHRWVITANGCWTCSGLVAQALTVARVPIQPDGQWNDPATFSPADLAAVLHPTVAAVPQAALT